MKRSALLLLLSSLLLSSVSCGGAAEPEQPQKNDAESVQAAQPAETEAPGIPEPDIPEKDYGGADFTYLIRNGNVASYVERYVFSEGEDGEPINDAIYARNIRVEEKFNIHICALNPTWQGGWAGELENLARKYILTNDPGIDVLSSMRSTLGTLLREGCLYNLNELKYVDLTSAWWDANAAETLEFGGKLYLMPNDISMGNLAMARFIYFNQGIVGEFDLEDPYALVEQNKWTIDKMLEMASAVSVDVNGDSVFDHNDKYGMLTDESANGSFVTLVAGAGITLAAKDEKGMIVPNIMTEKVQEMITKCSTVLKKTDCAVSSEELFKMGDVSGYDNAYDYPRDLFAQGHFLFYSSGISSMEQFRDMQQDFGIVPNPKFNESQEKYYHKIDTYALIFGVPICASDMERVGAVLEYSAWLSHQTLLPAYYETTVKGKRLRDDKAIEMLDLIKGSMLYDFSDIYDLGGAQILYNAYNSGNLASTYSKGEKAYQKKIDKLMTDLNALE